MAYIADKKYWLKSNAGQASGKYLNVYGNEQVSNLRNVTLYTKVDCANSQGWFISSRSAGLKLLTALDTSYGVDHYNGSDNLGNCDIYQEYGSDTNSVILMESVDSSQNIYRIKLKNHSNRYLTAKTNDDVKWEASNDSVSQQWKLEPWNVPSSKIIAGLGIRSIYNQKYKNNSTWMQTSGCAVCAACSVSAFYKGSAYTLTQAFADGMYDESMGVKWANAKYFSTVQITGLTQAGYLTKIREQISLQKPVLVHMVGSSQHWTVAYEYSGAGTSTDQILVLDSVHHKDDQYGVTRTLNISMDLNFDSFTISEIRTTSKK